VIPLVGRLSLLILESENGFYNYYLLNSFGEYDNLITVLNLIHSMFIGIINLMQQRC
jgi:hypothetical protein